MTADAAVFPDDVEVAIVSFNGRATLPRVLEALDASGVPGDRITLIDNASTDGTADWLASDRPAIRVSRLATNTGPNPARNHAIRAATRPFVLLLDSDAYVDPRAIAALRRAMQPSGRVAVTVPVVVHDDRPDRIQYCGASLHFMCEATSIWPDRPLADRGTTTRDIGTAPGLCMLVDVGAARAVGLFDDRYFMGKEDGEFCYRLRLAGYRIVEEPAATVRHGSRPRSTWLFSYQLRNRWHFMLKNYELATLLVLTPALLIHEPLQFALVAARGQAGAWFRAVRSLRPWLSTLSRERRGIRQMRTVHDREILRATPLTMRSDMVGGSAGQVFKRLYDAWLAFYWRLASRVLP